MRGWALGVLALSFLCLIGYILVFVPWISENEFRALVNEHVPIGAKRSDVEEWLRARDLWWNDVADESGKIVGLAGSFHNYRVGDFTLINYEFYFDDDDRLARTVIYERTHLF